MKPILANFLMAVAFIVGACLPLLAAWGATYGHDTTIKGGMAFIIVLSCLMTGVASSDIVYILTKPKREEYNKDCS